MSNPSGGSAFELCVELLEDLHTGTGMGSAVVDRALARDRDGTPVIPREHIKGVWLDAARRLARLGQIGSDPDATIAELFGGEGAKRGCLIAPELRAWDPRPAVFWDATARKPGDRAPDDHSLRRTEYLPAGTVLSGRGRLTRSDPALRDAFVRIARFANALGSERSRGSGLIRIALDWAPAAPAVFAAAGAPAAIATGLRLLLRAQAPLCIATTGAPGNIIPSEDHIPGRSLLGALAAWIGEGGSRASVLFERRVGVGPAYPLPPDLPCDDAAALGGLSVIPMPLNLWTAKPRPQPESPLPHWVTGAGAATCRDMLAEPLDPEVREPDGVPDKTRYKRPKDGAYLVRTDGRAWQPFAAALGLRMRNRRGDPFETPPETDADLYTVEQIPSGTRFLADLYPLDPGDTGALPELFELLGALLVPGAREPAPLRIGRGGAPVAVTGWCPRPPADGAQTTGPTLILTLISDLIARTPDLRFHAELSLEAVLDCLDPHRVRGVSPDPETRARGFSETQRYAAFNAVSGLPAAARLAIRRGSVLRVEGPVAGDLVARLQRLGAIGEQTWEGNGRFLLQAPGADNLVGSGPGGAPRDDDLARTRARRDRIVRAAEALCPNAESVKRLPSASQLGNLRALLAAEGRAILSPQDLDALLAGYRKEVEARRSRDDWAKAFGDLDLPQRMREACEEGGACRTQDLELFLRVLTLRKKGVLPGPVAVEVGGGEEKS